MSAPRLDTALIRRRRAKLGLSARAVASELGITGAGYTAIESGLGNQSIDLGTLVRLSSALGLSVGELLGTPPTPTEEEADDAAALGALLLTLGERTPVGSLLEALEWTLERLHAAERGLSGGLARVGMRIHRSNSSLAIVPGVTAVADEARVRAVRQGMARNHVSLQEARMLRHIVAGDTPTQPSNPERVALAVLINAGLVAFEPAQSPKTEAPIVLAADVRYSLLLDEMPDEAAPVSARRRRSPATVAGARERTSRHDRHPHGPRPLPCSPPYHPVAHRPSGALLSGANALGNGRPHRLRRSLRR